MQKQNMENGGIILSTNCTLCEKNNLKKKELNLTKTPDNANI